MACLLIVTALAINAPGLMALGYQLRYQREVAALPLAAPFAANDRLLVIAPHPDDETLACAGSIIAARRAGAEVRIVWLTSGDAFEWGEVLSARGSLPTQKHMLALGRRRMSEAHAAALILGVAPEEQVFLGYPDGGLFHLVFEHYTAPFRSHYTGASAVPYADAVAPGAAYTGASLERSLGKVVDSFKPTLALVPSVDDHHPDHRAAAFLALRVFSRRGWTDRLRFYIVHGGTEWPMPKGLHLHPALPLVPAPRGHGLAWQRVDLTPDDVQTKLAAIREHQSQLKAVPHFLFAFVRTNEIITAQAARE